MKRTAVAWSIPLALAAGLMPWARAAISAPASSTQGVARVTLEMDHAKPADVAQRLGEALGGEVRFEGTIPEELSLSITDLPVTEALDKIAAAASGKWERAYRFSKNSTPKTTAPARTGHDVTLRVSAIPCATAAAMVAHMAGARIEKDGEIEGTVTLSAEDIPVEDALDTIARAAGMEWRPIYVLRISPKPAPAATNPAGAHPKNPSGDNPRQMTDPNKRASRPKPKRNPRTKYNQLGSLGAQGPVVSQAPDPQKLEELSKFGQFAPIFGIEDKDDRQKRIKQFRSLLETSAHRLDTFEPRYRRAALQVSVMQLRQLVLDFDTLSADQKKEIEPIMEFVRDRLRDAESLIRGQN